VATAGTKEPVASYSLIKSVVTLDSPKTKAAGRAFDRFAPRDFTAPRKVIYV
jgi:hypothetical protein